MFVMSSAIESSFFFDSLQHWRVLRLVARHGAVVIHGFFGL